MKFDRSLLALLATLLALGCSGRHERPAANSAGSGGSSLTIKGSDTMVILSQKWAERFMQDHAGQSIQVSGGGSGTGIAALLNGTADLANSSRPIKAREREELRRQRNAEVQEFRVALDALAVYVHASSPVTSLSLAQLKSIYRGETTNWRDLGGPDGAIVLYSRENNSGTYAYFKEHVLDDEDFAANAQTLQGTAAVINSVARDPRGIGYGGIAYAEGVRSLPIRLDDGTTVEPTMENAVSGRYPISRYLYVYSVGAPSELGRRFLDFATSEAGQQLVTDVGYFPLPRNAAPAANP